MPSRKCSPCGVRLSLSMPTRSRALAICSAVGRLTGRLSGPKPHRLTRGPTVTSSLPWVRRPASMPCCTILAMLAGMGMGALPASWLKREMREPGS
ncbi:hypothetical protein D3C72_1516970 [compost metagenome]